MIDPILITGCARSGTSMVAGVVHLSGAFGGKLVGPTPHNKRGMFENNEMRNTITKPYLKSIDMDPMGQSPLPDTTQLFNVSGWREKVERVLNQQGYKDGPWFVKEAKSCLIWPVWHHAFPHAKWVIVQRKEGDIIDSCLRTPFMRAFKDRAGWRGWIVHHLRCFEEMRLAGLDVTEIWPNPSDLLPFQALVFKLGLEWSELSVKNFLSPELYHVGEQSAV